MKKGTRITYRGKLYNEDGDRPVNFGKKPSIESDEDFKNAMEDDEMQFMFMDDERIFGINKLKFDSKNFLLLEPNPVTFYFALAHDSLYL